MLVTQSNMVGIPTSVKSTITGDQGETLVYKITAHNYSKTDSYVYTGMVYGPGFESTANNLTISASTDGANANPLPNNTSMTTASGNVIDPGEDFVFYATYTLGADISAGEILVNYVFKSIIYTVTYLNNNQTYAVDHIIDNSSTYYVRNDVPTNGDLVFAGWINANAVVVTSYPAGNTNDYTLPAKWDNTYVIIFVDEHGTVIHQESFTDTSKKTGLSAEGQAIVDAQLAEWAAAVAKDDMSVAWSDYDIANATSDITVRPIYTYNGNLRFTPIDENGDGIIDHYQVDAVNKLNDPTVIPGRFNGLSVRVVNKLYLNDNNFDYGAGVSTIEVGEGVEEINHNALAYTADLATVKLPSTLQSIGKNAFSRNFSSDRKVLTIQFNGTMAEWQQVVNNSHSDWHNGLFTGTTVQCTDGYYELDRGWLGQYGSSYTWEAHPN